MVHAAVFDAVNSIDRRYEPYFGRVPAQALVLAGRSRRGGRAPHPHQRRESSQARLSSRRWSTRDRTEYTGRARSRSPKPGPKSGGIATGEAAAWVMIGDPRPATGRDGPPGFFDPISPRRPWRLEARYRG